MIPSRYRGTISQLNEQEKLVINGQILVTGVFYSCWKNLSLAWLSHQHTPNPKTEPRIKHSCVLSQRDWGLKLSSVLILLPQPKVRHNWLTFSNGNNNVYLVSGANIYWVLTVWCVLRMSLVFHFILMISSFFMWENGNFQHFQNMQSGKCGSPT